MATYNVPAKIPSRSWSFVKRIDWVMVALLITPYVIATIWFIFSTKFWSSAAQPFAEFVITHRSLIRAATAIMAAMSALFFFWPRDGGRLAGWWSGFVGLAFTTFLVQYSLRFIDPRAQSAFSAPNASII